jgi:hypothetical protein
MLCNDVILKKYCFRSERSSKIVFGSVGYPDVSGPPGSGNESFSMRYGSGSFYHQAKIAKKPSLLLFWDFFFTFYL